MSHNIEGFFPNRALAVSTYDNEFDAILDGYWYEVIFSLCLVIAYVIYLYCDDALDKLHNHLKQDETEEWLF